MLADRVAEKIAERMADVPKALLDRAELARAFGISTPTVCNLVRRGMPELRIGSAPRYELGPCLAWLRNQSS